MKKSPCGNVQGTISGFKKGSIFCEVFAEGSLPERHTLVKKKGQFPVRCSPKAACRSVTPWLKKRDPFLVRCSPKAACRSVTPRFQDGRTFFCKRETFVFWHMTEISARNLVQNDRTDVPHLFGFIKIIRNQETQVLIKTYCWHLVKNVKVGSW